MKKMHVGRWVVLISLLFLTACGDLMELDIRDGGPGGGDADADPDPDTLPNCDDYCELMDTCTGDNLQYNTAGPCRSFCENLPLESISEIFV